jgi:AcrR family transcriptional regulator
MRTQPVTRAGKKAKVRDAILRAAVDLFERRGFERTTVDEIAATAEVSTRTFFRYFPTKEAVMFPYHAAYVERFRRLLRESRGDSPLETVQRALARMTDEYTAARGEHLRHQRIIGASPALVASSVAYDMEWESAIADAWATGRRGGAAARRRARLAAGIIMGAINAVMATWYDGGCREDLGRLGESALRLLERGIGNGAESANQRRPVRRRRAREETNG